MSEAAEAADETTPSIESSGRRTIGISAAIAVTVLVLDQLTKHWALNSLQDHDVEVVWTLRFNLAYNTGMAFSRGQGLGPIIGVLALVVVVFMLVRIGRDGGTVSTIATGLIVGGALGNVADRLFRGDGLLDGAVIDFIDFQWFPIFNVADMGITVGGVLLVLSALVADSPGRGTKVEA